MEDDYSTPPQTAGINPMHMCIAYALVQHMEETPDTSDAMLNACMDWNDEEENA